MNNDLNINLHHAKENLNIYLFSVIIFLTWYLSGHRELVELSPFTIYLGNISYFIILLIPAFLVLNNKLLLKIWIFFSSLSILDLSVLIYTKNNQDFPVESLYNGSLIAILILLLFANFLFSISSQYQNKKDIDLKGLAFISLTSLFFIIIYHGSNYYLKIVKNIPNEERSFYVNGLEFHHINYGLVIFILLPLLYMLTLYANGKLKKLIYFAIGFAYGTVIDESIYYMLTDVSDDAYFYNYVIVLQLVIWFAVFFIQYYFIKMRKYA